MWSISARARGVFLIIRPRINRGVLHPFKVRPGRKTLACPFEQNNAYRPCRTDVVEDLRKPRNDVRVKGVVALWTVQSDNRDPGAG